VRQVWFDAPSVKNKKGQMTLPFVHLQHDAACANYFEAAGAAAAEADASAAAFFFLLVFLALAGLAEASAEAAAGAEAEAEAGASAAKAEAANRPAIKAAISFFILTSLYQVMEVS